MNNEKSNNENLISKRNAPWLKKKVKYSDEYQEMIGIVYKSKLNTVCQEARCPNITECWAKKHVTFMILGNICTRSCKFCNIQTGRPNAVSESEPREISAIVKQLGAKHVVLTSVDRDDLYDGGASQFSKCVKFIREMSPGTTIEILTPDFRNKIGAQEIILENPPDVFNHNLETVERLYPNVKPGARYNHSLNLLRDIKAKNPSIFTKSGIIVGMGETNEEVLSAIDDLKRSNVDFLTIGQYLSPSSSHMKELRIVTPEEFKFMGDYARGIGFKMVSSSPFTRSSYHADEDFEKLKKVACNDL